MLKRSRSQSSLHVELNPPRSIRKHKSQIFCSNTDNSLESLSDLPPLPSPPTPEQAKKPYTVTVVKRFHTPPVYIPPPFPLAQAFGCPSTKHDHDVPRYIEIQDAEVRNGTSKFTNDPKELCLDEYFSFSSKNKGHHFGLGCLRPVVRKRNDEFFLMVDLEHNYFVWGGGSREQIGRVVCDIVDADDAAALYEMHMLTGPPNVEWMVTPGVDWNRVNPW